ncbi:hypothetical protein OE88DRAFT_1740497 [Heliocybe sulcata]|uniref:Uncharacterized protein n=1 Tax=Heliocybe sulcata TaxID=5364 RepID=A0A5C3MIQ8_9AGAM|nr:hypothetical protein OE88DRAFT_1740497 [Heliocybe sulcata]
MATRPTANALSLPTPILRLQSRSAAIRTASTRPHGSPFAVSRVQVPGPYASHRHYSDVLSNIVSVTLATVQPGPTCGVTCRKASANIYATMAAFTALAPRLLLRPSSRRRHGPEHLRVDCPRECPGVNTLRSFSPRGMVALTGLAPPCQVSTTLAGSHSRSSSGTTRKTVKSFVSLNTLISRPTRFPPSTIVIS